MRLHYKGQFSGDLRSLPRGERRPGAVPFREPESIGELAKLTSVIAVVCFVPLFLLYEWLGHVPSLFAACFGVLLSFAAALPHELLHAVCFREDVYLYHNLKQGMLFVVGPETMSRGRFILMSLLPNLVFGALPFAVFLLDHEMTILGAMGMTAIPMGAGDYLNVWHAARQMPRGARTYLDGFHSWWYMPGEEQDRQKREQ